MSEQNETQDARQEPAKPNGAAAEPEPVDWEAKYKEAIAHSRDWEKKAKANNKAATELEELKKSQMTELERAVAERDEYKALVDSLNAEKERASWVSEVSKETDVPADVLDMIGAENKEELLEKARAISEKLAAKGGTVPVVLGDGQHAQENKGVSANDFFRAKFQQMNH